MKNSVIKLAFALSIIAGGVGAAAPGHAAAPTFKLYNHSTYYSGSHANPLCLGLQNGGTADGTRFVVAKCDPMSANQNFYTTVFPTAGSSLTYFDNAANKVIGVSGASKNPGADVILWQWYPSRLDQVWTLDSTGYTDWGGRPCYRLRNRNSNQYLGVAGGVPVQRDIAPGTKTVQWPDQAWDQVWCIH
jgi:hypothetical protein